MPGRESRSLEYNRSNEVNDNILHEHIPLSHFNVFFPGKSISLQGLGIH